MNIKKLSKQTGHHEIGKFYNHMVTNFAYPGNSIIRRGKNGQKLPHLLVLSRMWLVFSCIVCWHPFTSYSYCHVAFMPGFVNTSTNKIFIRIISSNVGFGASRCVTSENDSPYGIATLMQEDFQGIYIQCNSKNNNVRL